MKKRTEKVSSNQQGWKTTKSQRGWYFIGRIGTYNLQALIPMFMNLFLIFNGVNLAQVAAITLIVKIIDAMDDMVFGFLVDKIDLKKSKLLSRLGGQGRYLPWLRCFMYFFPFAIFLFFLMPSALPGGAKLVWFAVTYLLFDFTYTLVDVPVQSTLLTLSDIPEERNHLTTIGFVLVTAFALGTALMQQFLISEHVGLSVRTVAFASIILFTAMMLPMPFKLNETNAELKNTAEKGDENYTVREMFRAIKTNKPYLLCLLSQVIPALCATGTGVTLFVSYYLYGSSTAMLLPTTIGVILLVIAEMCAPKISKRFGNKKPLVFSLTLVTVSSFAIYFIGYRHFTVVVALTLLNTVIGGIVTMLRAYIGLQAIEYGKYKVGRDTTGIFNSISTFTSKVTSSVASSAGLLLLSLFGWTTVNAESFADLAAQGIEQTASALSGLWVINSLIPAFGTLLGLAVIIFYRLDDEDARLMGLCNAGEISREECESRLSRKY